MNRLLITALALGMAFGCGQALPQQDTVGPEQDQLGGNDGSGGAEDLRTVEDVATDFDKIAKAQADCTLTCYVGIDDLLLERTEACASAYNDCENFSTFGLDLSFDCEIKHAECQEDAAREVLAASEDAATCADVCTADAHAKIASVDVPATKDMEGLLECVDEFTGCINACNGDIQACLANAGDILTGVIEQVMEIIEGGDFEALVDMAVCAIESVISGDLDGAVACVATGLNGIDSCIDAAECAIDCGEPFADCAGAEIELP